MHPEDAMPDFQIICGGLQININEVTMRSYDDCNQRSRHTQALYLSNTTFVVHTDSELRGTLLMLHICMGGRSSRTLRILQTVLAVHLRRFHKGTKEIMNKTAYRKGTDGLAL